jgi:hypothetical protein
LSFRDVREAHAHLDGEAPLQAQIGRGGHLNPRVAVHVQEALVAVGEDLPAGESGGVALAGEVGDLRPGAVKAPVGHEAVIGRPGEADRR